MTWYENQTRVWLKLINSNINIPINLVNIYFNFYLNTMVYVCKKNQSKTSKLSKIRYSNTISKENGRYNKNKGHFGILNKNTLEKLYFLIKNLLWHRVTVLMKLQNNI